MPPRARTSKPAAPQAKHARPDGDICPECWPNGWPKAANNASCRHGRWKR